MVIKEKIKKIFHREFFFENYDYLIVVIFCLLASLVLITSFGIYIKGDDAIFHIYRYHGSVNALLDGQFPPRVDPSSANGYGYGYNLFYGPLPTYIVSLFYLIFHSWPIANNLFTVLCIIASGLMMLYFMKLLINNKSIRAIASVSFALSPYLMSDIYIRCDSGEFFSYLFIPLLFAGLHHLINKEKHSVRDISISAICVVLSHNISAAILALLSFIFLLFNFKKILNWWCIKKILLSLCLILGATAYFIFPLLELRSAGLYSIFNEEFLTNCFGCDVESLNSERVTLFKFLIPIFDSVYAQDHIILGFVGLVGLIGFPFICNKIEKKIKYYVIIFYVICWLLLILSSELIDWECVPLQFRIIQFPWRFIMYYSFFISVIFAVTIYYIFKSILKSKKSKIWFSVIVNCICLIFVSHIIFLFIIDRVTEEEVYSNDPAVNMDNGCMGWEQEYMPLVYDNKNLVFERKEDIVVTKGNAEINSYNKDGLKITFNINNKSTDCQIELPLSYYPGYSAQFEDGSHVELTCLDSGLVGLNIPSNKSGQIKVAYGMSNVAIAGLFTSIITIFIVVVFYVFRKKIYKRN